MSKLAFTPPICNKLSKSFTLIELLVDYFYSI